MKLVFSRKGCDSSAGGMPSPIFPDNRLWSIPIPDARSPLRYRDIQHPAGAAAVARDLSNRRLNAASRVHLDPDLDAATLPREAGWRRLFGQHGAAHRHLQHQRVGCGDLLLFFGWFRQVERIQRRWRYRPAAADLHVLFGWMQIGEVAPVERYQADWARYHPHYYGRYSGENCLYIAADQMHWPGVSAPPAGVFEHFDTRRVLTAPGATRSQWRLPAWLHPAGRGSCLSYHADLTRWLARDDSVLLRSAARGQEFVLDVDHYPEAIEWVSRLFQV